MRKPARGKKNRAMICVCVCVCPVIMVCESRKHTVPVFATGVPGSQTPSAIGGSETHTQTHSHAHTGYLASEREKHAVFDTCGTRQADFLHFPTYWAATCNTFMDTCANTHKTNISCELTVNKCHSNPCNYLSFSQHC